MNGVEGFMYPNEIGLQWSVLIVLYPFITGLVAGAFILASLERVFQRRGGEADVPAGASDGALVSDWWHLCRCNCTWAIRSARRKCTSRRTAHRRWRCSATCISGI